MQYKEMRNTDDVKAETPEPTDVNDGSQWETPEYVDHEAQWEVDSQYSGPMQQSIPVDRRGNVYTPMGYKRRKQ